jgi:large subunit ribosomal protein L13
MCSLLWAKDDGMMTVINAEDCIAGRLASHVAKRLLKGEEIVIVNAEKAIVSGNPKAVEGFFAEKIKRGDPYHGPFYPKLPEKILRRIVRGMLPFGKPRGREAYRRLKVYRSVPEDFKGKGMETIGKAKGKLEHKFVYLGKVSEKFGG